MAAGLTADAAAEELACCEKEWDGDDSLLEAEIILWASAVAVVVEGTRKLGTDVPTAHHSLYVTCTGSHIQAWTGTVKAGG